MSPHAWLIVVLILSFPTLAVIDRLLLHLERRGWITYRTFYPRIRGTSGPAGAMGFLQELVQPEVRHAHEDLDQRQASRADASNADGTPGAAPPSPRSADESELSAGPTRPRRSPSDD